MSRQPAVVALAGGKSARQRVWEAIRLLSDVSDFLTDGSFLVDDLSRKSKVELPIVREYVRCLMAAGYLQWASTDDRGPVKNRYVLAKNNGVEAPRVRRDGSPVTQGRGTEAMWGAITALDTFTHAELAQIANVKPATAANYCGFLGRAGYLDLVRAGHGTGRGGIASVWRCALVHKHKPRAPMVTRLKVVYDPNVHAIVWQPGAADAADAAADQIDLGEVVE
ncbi:MAG TPA: hypothetical protein PK947_05875 [Ottowia sp.]|jgi:Mn-dependent DtxR family transcriptional regulator|nr:hypothetical protein [Ottowia sp.]